ncbi:asparaginase [Pseudomonas aeruginosa VRFPA07]|nr:asparaginase [Pseudomonas aeruginosa VRFPA07]
MLPVKNLFVLYTGGTIGMLRTPQGLAPASGFEARMRDHLQSLGDAPDLRWRFAELQPPLDSANMTQGNWLAMRDAIVAALDAGHDGVLLLHGTDTLAYSAAALSFLLLDLPIPVLLTGSMLPAGAPGSDAWDNLVGALRVLQEGHARGVQVYFNDALLHGARVSKLRSDAFDAFAELPRPRHAEHAPVPAALGYRQPRREVNLAVLPLYPGLRAAHLRGLLDSGVEALLLECYGSGTGPSDDEELLATLREAHARGVLLAAVSQCAYGQVEFGVYAAGSRLPGLRAAHPARDCSTAAWKRCCWNAMAAAPARPTTRSCWRPCVKPTPAACCSPRSASAPMARSSSASTPPAAACATPACSRLAE